MASAFPIRTSLVLMICFLFAPAAARAQTAASALVLGLDLARPYVIHPQAFRDAFRGSWGLAASALYAFPSQLEVGLCYDLSSLQREDLAAGASGGTVTVQAVSAVGGFASAPELPVQVFFHLGPALVLSTSHSISSSDPRLEYWGYTAGAVGRIGVRIPLGNDVFASAAGSTLVFETGELSRTVGTLQVGLTIRSPIPSSRP